MDKQYYAENDVRYCKNDEQRIQAEPRTYSYEWGGVQSINSTFKKGNKGLKDSEYPELHLREDGKSDYRMAGLLKDVSSSGKMVVDTYDREGLPGPARNTSNPWRPPGRRRK